MRRNLPLSLLLCLSASAAQASPASTPSADESDTVINADASRRISRGNSIAPIIGYGPTYGLLLGGALFRGDTDGYATNFGLQAYGSFENVFAVELKSKLWDSDNRFYSLDVEAQNLYDSYFGEGGDTDPRAQLKIDNRRLTVTGGAWHRFDRRWGVGLLPEARLRQETGVFGDPSRRVFGDEARAILSVGVLHDSRDHEVDSRAGHYFLAEAGVGPSGLSTSDAAETFGRVRVDARAFVAPMPSLVFAGQIKLATAAGEPGFLYRSLLGGSRDLRGYQSNRLRGRHVYLLQGEARWSLARWFSLVGFAGLGDAADRGYDDFGRPKPAGGMGVRLGLPPDFVAKARLDYAVSRDEKAIYLNFNEAF